MIRTPIRFVAGVATGAILLSSLSGADAARRWHPRKVHRAATQGISANTMTGSYTYDVQAGDTLRSIADNYFANRNDKGALRDVQRFNHIQHPDRLTVGSKIVVPRKYLSIVPARAIVSAFRGTVTLGPNRPAKVNAVATEGTRIETGANSGVSLLLEDGSTISLPSQSVFTLERLRLVLLTGELEHVFRLDQGRSQFVVSPAKGPASRFQVRTPVSVSAVRGTEFRVAVEDGGHTSLAEVLKDNVEVTGKAGGDGMIPEGFGVKANEQGVGKPIKLLPFPQVVLPVVKNSDGSLTFNIKPIDGAAHYRLQIAADLAFQDVRAETVSEKPTFGIPTSPVGNYYVRVTAIDSNGLEGLQHIYPFEYHQ